MGEFILTVIKVLLTILLLPFVVTATVHFESQLTTYPSIYHTFFNWGLFAFVISYLFIYPFYGVYDFGQKAMQGMLKFTSPMHRFMAYLLPFYFLFAIGAYNIVIKFLKVRSMDPYFVFFSGFVVAMHLVNTAQELQESEKSFFKPSYIFSMSFVYLGVILLAVLLFDFTLNKFTILTFLENVLDGAKDMYLDAIWFIRK
ncbi:MAG: hypothetical protein KC713_02345 [Candidatus Omnitrophica bacterium]|nr:hypothetical protein [Candidatus Omnitrophota bacterium]